jgi:hypothetical protein
VAQELAGQWPAKAQELAGQCAKAPGRDRAHQWDQVTRECRGLEVPEHRGHAARAEQLGQAGPVEQLGQVVPVEQLGQVGPVEQLGWAGPVEQLGREALEGDQADTKLQYGTWDVISSVHIPIPG